MPFWAVSFLWIPCVHPASASSNLLVWTSCLKRASGPLRVIYFLPLFKPLQRRALLLSPQWDNKLKHIGEYGIIKVCDFYPWISSTDISCLSINEFKNIMNSLKEFLSIFESTFSSRGHRNLPEDDLFIHYYIHNHLQQAAFVRAVYIATWTKYICMESNATNKKKEQQPVFADSNIKDCTAILVNI